MPAGGGVSIATVAAITAGAQALSSVLGGIFGASASKAEREAAAAATERALAEIERVGAPPNIAKAIILREYKKAGVWSPEVEKKVDLGVSKVAEIQEDPALKAAQMGALQKFQQLQKGGMTPEGRAMLAESMAQSGRSAQARLQQILGQQQARGLGSAGSTLAAQIQAASAAASDESDAALKASAMASQARAQAIAQTAQLGSQIRGQEFDIARTKAGAEDQFALQRFNEAMSRQQRNVATSNAASQYNLAQEQNIMNANVAQQNTELQRQRAAEAQMYQMALTKAGMMANALTGQAQQHRMNAAQTQQGMSDIFGGISQGIGAVGTGVMQQQAQDKADARFNKYFGNRQQGLQDSFNFGNYASNYSDSSFNEPGFNYPRSSSNWSLIKRD
jgi:hypothetical protein